MAKILTVISVQCPGRLAYADKLYHFKLFVFKGFKLKKLLHELNVFLYVTTASNLPQ